MASLPIEYMRDAVSKAYPGPKWKAKVGRMYDNQIIALYHKFYHSEENTEEKNVKVTPQFKPYEGEQMTFEGLG